MTRTRTRTSSWDAASGAERVRRRAAHATRAGLCIAPSCVCAGVRDCVDVGGCGWVWVSGCVTESERERERERERGREREREMVCVCVCVRDGTESAGAFILRRSRWAWSRAGAAQGTGRYAAPLPERAARLRCRCASAWSDEDALRVCLVTGLSGLPRGSDMSGPPRGSDMSGPLSPPFPGTALAHMSGILHTPQYLHTRPQYLRTSTQRGTAAYASCIRRSAPLRCAIVSCIARCVHHSRLCMGAPGARVPSGVRV